MEKEPTKDSAAGDSSNGDRDGAVAIPTISIPEHELLSRIGRGSYGEVWMARSSMGMLRAIKIVYRKSFQDARPFERELSGIRKFEPISRSHEGFIDVLHAGINQEEGYFYYIMELADDEDKGQEIDPKNYHPRTLSRELGPEGKLPLPECLSLGLGLSRALAELHKHGLVHRDIKPSNIIFVHGVAKLADIGLVAEMKEAQSYVGTEGFIPPEGPGKPQADIYGLGKVLYEACTGKDRNDFPELPTNWDGKPESDLFLELNEVIVHACKNDPSKRYETASDMHADLVLVSNGKSVRRLRILERRWAKLKRTAVAAGVALLASSAITYHLYWQWRTRLEMRQRDVGGFVVSGTMAVEEGDLITGLTNFSQSLTVDLGNREQEALQRFRFGSVLDFCPRLEYLGFCPLTLDKIGVSRDGGHFLALKENGPVWSMDRQKPVTGSELFGQTNVYEAAYSPDGTQIAIGGTNEASIWHGANGKEVCQLPHPGDVMSVAYTQDGKHLLTGCKDHLARLWNLETQEAERSFAGHTDDVCHVTFSATEDLAGTAGHDGMAIIWKVSTKQPLKIFAHGRGTWVYHVAFSPDGKLFATACSDHRARVFEVESGRQIAPDLWHNDVVMCVEFSPDGRFLLTAGLDQTARIWSVTNHEALTPAGILPHSGRVMQAHFLADGHHIVTACYDGTIRLWDLAGAMVLPREVASHFSPEGSRLVNFSNHTAVARETASGEELARWTNGLESEAAAVEWSANGRFVVEHARLDTNSEGFVAADVRDTQTGNLKGSIQFPEPQRGVGIDNSARLLVSFGRTNLYVWDVAQGEQFCGPFGHKEAISNAFISADGRRAGLWSQRMVRVWECEKKGQEILSQPLPAFAQSVVLSPDGKFLATCSSDGDFTNWPARILAIDPGHALPFELTHNDGILCAAFSPDGRYLVTGSEDFTARIWDLRTGKPVGHPLRHREQVNSVAYSADGKWILTGSADKTARVWNARTGDPLSPPLRHLSAVMQARFVGKEATVLTLDVKGKQRLWNLSVERAAAAEVAELSHFLSGQFGSQLLASGLDHRSLSNAWNRVRRLRPQLFTVSREQVMAWHDFEAQQSALESNWEAARFHLQRMLETDPGNTSSILKRLDEVQGHLQQPALETRVRAGGR